MRRWPQLSLIALVGGVLCGLLGHAFAQLPWGNPAGATVASGPVSGPCDLISPWRAFYSLRACGTGFTGGTLITVTRASDATTHNIVALGNGNMDVSTASSFCSGTTCHITTWVDQTGNGFDMVQSTLVNAPVLTFNCISTLPCATFTAANTQWLFSGSRPSNATQPYTFNAVVESSTNTTQYTINGFDGSSGSALFLARSGAGTADLYCGATLTGTQAAGSYHSMTGVCNGVSSVLNIDGTEVTGNAGSSPGVATEFDLGRCGGCGTKGYLDGQLVEAALNSAGLTGGQRSSVCHNQHVYWQTPTAC